MDGLVSPEPWMAGGDLVRLPAEHVLCSAPLMQAPLEPSLACHFRLAFVSVKFLAYYDGASLERPCCPYPDPAQRLHLSVDAEVPDTSKASLASDPCPATQLRVEADRFDLLRKARREGLRQ